MGCGGSTNGKELARWTTSAPLPQSPAASTAPMRRATADAASSAPTELGASALRA